MANPVTDPDLLAMLNAPDAKSRVTDPTLIAQLEGGSGPSGLVGATGDVAPYSVVRSTGSAIDNLVRALANGVTLGGADRIAAGAGAATGIGGNRGDYAGNLQTEQARTDQFAEEHPAASIAGNVVGGAVMPLGILNAARGAGLAAKTAYGAATGAGLGGIQGALSSKDLTDVAQTGNAALRGAEFGGALGALVPAGGKVIGAGYNAAANAITGKAAGMTRSATQHLVQAMTADGSVPVQQRLAALGDDAMLADAGPSFLAKTQGAVGNNEEARTLAMTALANRNQGTNARIMRDVNEAIGPAEDPQTVTNAIRAHRAEVDAVNYGQALGQDAPHVDTTGVLTELGPMIHGSVGMEQRALTNLRDMMMVEHQGRIMPQTDPRILHKFKGELDNVIEYDAPGLGVPAAALSRQQGALRLMRGQLNAALENQVPGYAQANAASSALARRGEAVGEGTQFLGSGKTTPSPERHAIEFSFRDPGEQIAYAKGTRGEIERVLGTKGNDLQALRGELQGEGGWNTAKLANVYGQDPADQLVNTVDRNLRFRDTFNKINEGSQTDLRKSAREAMQPVPPGQLPLMSPNTTGVGLVLGGAKKALQAGYEAVRPDQTRSFPEIAQVLTAQGAERDRKVQAIIDALSRRRGNAVNAPIRGDRAALLAAIAESAYDRHGQRRRRQ